MIVPDNLRSGVSKAHRYEPDINPSYQDMASHYDVAILPPRVRRPKDKGKVEQSVLVVERWILACLRHETFFSLAQLNQRCRRSRSILCFAGVWGSGNACRCHVDRFRWCSHCQRFRGDVSSSARGWSGQPALAIRRGYLDGGARRLFSDPIQTWAGQASSGGQPTALRECFESRG